MSELENECPVVHLLPGKVHLALSPSILTTLLGSCVACTFWNARLGIGALCHGVLPRLPTAVQASERYHYVDFAIRDLLQQFDQLGTLRNEVAVKVFGGADVLRLPATTPARMTVGQQNCQVALEVLRNERIQLIAADMGGVVGRTISFNTGNGEVLVRRLSRNNGAPW